MQRSIISTKTANRRQEILLCSADKTSYMITVRHKGSSTTFPISSSADILSATLDAGVDLPHDCRVGNCLICPMMLVAGTVGNKDDDSTNPMHGGGYVLSCVSFAKSDLVVQALDEDDRLSQKYQKYIDNIYDSWRK
eukprot:gene28021-36902_t